MNNGQPAKPMLSTGGPPPFDELDLNHDGKVSFEEFVQYYRHTDAGPMQMLAQNGQGMTANTLTDILFKALDPDKDGRLSKEKLLAAEKLLRHSIRTTTNW